MTQNNATTRLLVAMCVLAGSIMAVGPSSIATAQTPSAPPKAPTNVVAVPTLEQIDVSWRAPIDGPTITDYLAVLQPTGDTCEIDPVTDLDDNGQFNCSFPGLTNGEEYRVRVRSRNSVGVTNAPIRRVRLSPQPATGLFALPDDEGAIVRWNPPRGVGFAADPGYIVRLVPQNAALASAECETEELECTFSSLVNEAIYDVIVERIGLGITASVGTTVTPSASAPEVVAVPGRPENIEVNSGNESVSISWTAATAGEPATSFVVLLDPGDHFCSTTGTTCEITGLTNETDYDIRLVAQNVGGSLSTELAGFTPVEGSAPIVAVRPARIYETRVGDAFTTADGLFANTGQRLPQRRTTIKIGGRLDIPEDAAAVVVNTTVIGPRTEGFVTLYPCTTSAPTASTLNFAARQVIANNTVVKLTGQGTFCVSSSARTDVAIDVTGYVPADSDIVTVRPARLFESRSGTDNVTVDGVQQHVGRSEAGETVSISIAGRADLPTQMSAAILNVAVVNPTEAGFVTLYPCDEPRPTASVLNHAERQTIAASATVQLGIDGDVCAYTSSEADLIVDFLGYAPTGSALATVSPARLLDTRVAGATVDGEQQGNGERTAGQVTTIEVAGRADIPDDATAAIVNVAAIRPLGPGFITLFGCDHERPLASTLNYVADRTVANSATMSLDEGGDLCLYNSSAAHVVVDVAGFLVD